MRKLLAVTICILLTSSVSICAGEITVPPVAEISPGVTQFLKKHCAQCHGPEREEGKWRLDTLPVKLTNDSLALKWQDILDALNVGKMPPKDEPQPPKAELTNAIESLTVDLQQARKRLADTGGRIVIRRMNRREYKRTLEVLLGVPVDVALLPEDGAASGFDTHGAGHYFSSLLLERYLAVGRESLAMSLGVPRGDSAKTDVKPITVHQGEHDIMRQVREKLDHSKGDLNKWTVEFKETGPPFKHPALVLYQKQFDVAKSYLARPESQSGVLVPFNGPFDPYGALISHIGWGGRQGGPKDKAWGRVKVRVRCGVDAPDSVPNMYLVLNRQEYWASASRDRLAALPVRGTIKKPQIVECEVFTAPWENTYFALGRRNWADPVTQPNVWIDWVEVESLNYDDWSAPAADRIFFRGQGDESDDYAREIIRRFCTEAFRREQPGEKYVDRIFAVFKLARDKGDTFQQAIIEALSVVLASPRFLYLVEPQSVNQPTRLLTDRELAVRLSYFLWSAPPDETLYELVESKRLRDNDVLSQQVDRMVASPKVTAFSEAFVSQWLRLDRLDTRKPSASLPYFGQNYDLQVWCSSRQEPIRFFETLLRDNLSVSNLIHSDFVVVDSVLADFYGLNVSLGGSFERVALPDGSPRGGLLGQSAILALSSEVTRTSPVERGTFVLRRLLNRPPPPPPANVPMLEQASIGKRSIQETLATHMKESQCASCHQRIDPLGYGLENFDPQGRWRTEAVSSEGLRFPLVNLGVMPDGKRPFTGAQELKARILEDRQDTLRGLTEALLSYALGRPLGFSDQDVVEQIVRETAESGYGMRTLFHKIVMSKPFISR